MSSLLDLHFIRPWWLLALVPAVALYWQMWRLTRTHRGWSQIIDPALLPHLLVSGTEEGKNSPVQMVLLGWLLATLAMAGPSWEKTPQPVQRKQDALVILLDLSQSMLAQDLEPSRLHRARRKLRDLMKLRKEGSTALIAYAGDAHIVAPLTDDTRTIANLVPALYPGMMPLAGNDTVRAVELALELFRAAGHLEGRILLLTDGIRDDRRDKIQQQLSGSNYSLSIIGVGTADGSPVPDAQGKLMKDASGAIVLARLDQSQLQQLARNCGGRYRDISLDDSDLVALTASPDLPQAEADQLPSAGPVRTTDSWHDAGYWLVMLCIPLALGAFRRGWVLGVIPLLLLLPAEPSSALDWQDLWQRPDQQAAALFDAGDAEAAANTFADPNWSAAAHYRAEHYNEAEQGYANSDTASAWYNRGNALARAGDIAAAINAYEQALQRQPELEDASFNKALLEQMQDQQQQQDQDQQQPQQQDQQQDQQDQDNQQQSNQEQDQRAEDSSGDDKPPEQEPEQEQEQEQSSPEEEPAPEPSPQQQQAQASDEPSEQDQATEKWLRQIPDDPAGLLRNKFRYESDLRKQQAPRETQNSDW